MKRQNVPVSKSPQESIGEQLPPAAELATALSVDRNTVLAAYRQLRDEECSSSDAGHASCPPVLRCR